MEEKCLRCSTTLQVDWLLPVQEGNGGLPKPGCKKLVSVQVVGGAKKGFFKGLAFGYHSCFFPEAAQNRTVLPTYICSLKFRKAVCLHALSQVWGLKWQVNSWTARGGNPWSSNGTIMEYAAYGEGRKKY